MTFIPVVQISILPQLESGNVEVLVERTLVPPGMHLYRATDFEASCSFILSVNHSQSTALFAFSAVPPPSPAVPAALGLLRLDSC